MNNLLEKVKIALNENNEALIKQIEDILDRHEQRDFIKMKSGDRFFYRDIEWIYLGMEQGGALCITADYYKEMPFDEKNRNDWNVSSLNKELNSKFLNKLNKKDLIPFEMDLVADNGDKTYGVTVQYVGILSCDQYRKYRKVIPKFNEWMWTCTPSYCGTYPSQVSCVRCINTDGGLSNGCAGDFGNVIPACVFVIKQN